MRKPNFFILGAPKCGTTSLSVWLREHSEVYMSPVKEPHFFNKDHDHNGIRSLQHYERLFATATAAHKAVGEASVWYLYSNSAVANIERYSPNSRFIVCLRNPIEMAYSLHEQKVTSGHENITEFEEAWRLNEDRLRGMSVTRWCGESLHLAYGSACRLGDQLERLLSSVERNRVFTVLLDDVLENPRREYLKVLAFLGVEDDGRLDFPVLNSAKERRSMLLRKMVVAAAPLNRRLRIFRGLGVLTSINRKNLRYRPRTPMSSNMRLKLQAYFRSDIEKLSEIVNRDLSFWLMP